MSTNAYRTTKLGEICEKPQYGYTASTNRERVGPKFLRITDLQEQRIDWSTVPWCEANQADLDKYKLSHGDVLVARIGATTGNTSIVVSPPSSVFASYLIRLRPARDVDPFFLYFYTKCRQFRDWIDAHKDSNLKGGVNVPVLLAAPVRLPPYQAQRKIAAILWKMQRAIATQDRLIAVTGDLKQSAMQQLFTHGLRGEALKNTEIGLVPESWRLARCEDITKTITVGVVVKPASHYVANGVPAFRSFNVREDFLDDRNLVYFNQKANDSILAKSKLATGDVLIVRTGYPGTSCVVPHKYDGANCIDLVLVKPNYDKVIPDFLSRFFNSHLGRAQTLSSSHGLAQQHLNVGAVKSTFVAVPSLDEQHAIAAALATIDRKFAHHQRKRAALHDLFQTTLHQLMTAQIRVADLDIDTSEIAPPQGATA